MFAARSVILALCLKVAAVSAAAGDNWQYDRTADSGACSISNKCGPERWGDITGGTSANDCYGETQSPINIVTATIDKSLSAVTATGTSCSTWQQYTDKSALGVYFSAAGCTNLTMTFKGVDYTMLQFHFHSPSEHTFGGGYADAEVHFVHADSDSNLAVIGVMLYAASGAIAGGGNGFLKNFWDAATFADSGVSDSSTLSASAVASAVNNVFTIDEGNYVNPYTSMLPVKKDYYHYNGSLTTYPCSKNVNWIVMKEPVYISLDDLTIIRDSVAGFTGTITDDWGNDNRPVQPLYDRTVTAYSTDINPTATKSWGYQPDNGGDCSKINKCGPDRWGDVIPDDGVTVNECYGTTQSPVNIVGATLDTTLNDITMTSSSEGCNTFAQESNYAAVAVYFTSAGCYNLTMTFSGKEYTMLGFHFHSPSENTIGGGYADAEVHFVHQAASDSSLAVIGVMLYASAGSVPGARNVFLRNMWDGAIGSDSTYSSTSAIAESLVTYKTVTLSKGEVMNPYATFMPTLHDYYTFQGSLTTYPCTSGVTWIVMTEPVFIAHDDLVIIRNATALVNGTIIDDWGNSARPVQALNGRTISMFSMGQSA